MDQKNAIEALAALAQSTRLEAFRKLVSAEPQGIAAGDLARLLDVPQNTLSSHLALLTRAGLAKSVRQGRSIIYRAEMEKLRGLVLYLLIDCCGGRPEICAPLLSQIDPCCPPERVR